MKKLIMLLCFCTGALFSQQSGARYLIVTNDNFYNDILPFAQWKNKKGLSTKVVKLSETGSSASQIRNYIVNAYNNWTIKPEYLLLVGAPNYLPFPTVNGTYSDNYYTNMNADIFNEILSGRLTVHSSTECQTVVNKILAYERSPDLNPDSTWFTDACLVIRQDGENPSDSIYWDDIRFAAGAMAAAGFREIDTLCNYWGNNANDILTSVNNGCAFVMYRGQGVSNWWSPFDVNPNSTANGDRLPIVLSFTCQTIGTGSTPATAEQWFLTGTPATPRGGAGYFATTTILSGGAHLRSAVCKGFIKGVFNNEWAVFGRACENGRRLVYSMYPSSGGDHEYYGFTTVGDPAMNIWTAIPDRISVEHDSVAYVGSDSLLVTVMKAAIPAESALVCIALDSTVYETGYTSPLGRVILHFIAPHPGVMSLTVNGENLKPYEGSVAVYDTAAYLAFSSIQINDSLGNANGVPNNGETVLLTAVLKNIGPSVAPGVRATLRTDDTLAYIIDSLALFGDISAYDSMANRNPFVLAIAPTCPDGHSINFHISMRDAAGDTWPADFFITVRRLDGSIGPDPYGYYIYDDTDTLSGNAPVYDWIEIDPLIGGPGALVSEITDEDADTVTYPLPFAFKYYDQDYDSIGLCSNGFAELGFSTYRFGANTYLPFLGGPKRLLAPFWDDLSPNINGDICFYSDTLDHCWILEFKDCSHYDNNANRESFQLVLRDPQFFPTPTDDGEMICRYQSVADASSNTVGIEDETESRGLQYLYDNGYNPNAAPLVPGRTLLITTKLPNGGALYPWLHIANYAVRDSAGGNNNGIPEPGETIAISVTVQNNGDTTAYNVLGDLTTTDPDAIIIDSLSGFGDIPVHAAANNLAAPFQCQIAALPADSTIGFRLRLTDDNSGHEQNDYFTVYLFIRLGTREKQNPMTDRPSWSLTAFPNPARGRVEFKLNPGIAHSAKGIALKIYDITGRQVKSFVFSSALSPMPSALCWDGTDQVGRAVPAGVYFVRLESGSQQRTVKLIRLR